MDPTFVLEPFLLCVPQGPPSCRPLPSVSVPPRVPVGHTEVRPLCREGYGWGRTRYEQVNKILKVTEVTQVSFGLRYVFVPLRGIKKLSKSQTMM